MRIKYSVAVAGAHGKTTTTSMVGEILARGDLDPTVIVGGRLQAVGAHARLGRGPVPGGGGRRERWLVPSPVADHRRRSRTSTRSTSTITRAWVEIRAAFLASRTAFPFYGTVVLPSDDPERGRDPPEREAAGADRTGSHGPADFAGTGPRASTQRNPLPPARAREGRGNDRAQGRPAPTTRGTPWPRSRRPGSCGIPLHDDPRRPPADFAGVGRRLSSRRGRWGARGSTTTDTTRPRSRRRFARSRPRADRRIVAVFQPHRYTRTRAPRSLRHLLRRRRRS